MQVHPETLKVTGQRTINGRQFDTYSVEVTIRGDRRAVRCWPIRDGNLDILDLAVRFQTGAKVWPGSAVYWSKTGNVTGLRPHIDKRGHVSLVGFFEDFQGKPVRSMHNAVA